MAAGVECREWSLVAYVLKMCDSSQLASFLSSPAEAANARAFVERLPEAYDTKVWNHCGNCTLD